MNPAITSKEAILEQCRLIVQKEGLSGLTMRHVADACGTALGSLYNYFPSKDALILESIRSIWESIFHQDGGEFDHHDFLSLVEWFVTSLSQGKKRYPGFFTLHALSLGSEEKEKGKAVREATFNHMKEMMLSTIKSDPKIRKDAFNQLDQRQFVDLIFLDVVYSELENWNDELGLKELINRAIY